MKIESQIDSRWVWRPLLIAVLLFGWGVYSLYDGFVAYPAHNEQIAKFKEFEQAGNLKEWPDYARERGWSEEKPAAAYSSTDIITQYIMAGICIPLGLIVLGYVGLHVPNKPYADDNAFGGWGGRDIPYDAVTEINKSRWDNKNIAVVKYDKNGSTGGVTIDAWKYRDGDKVLAEIERQTGRGTVLEEDQAPIEGPDEERGE